ncbi:flavocytochrome c [Oceanirhabdus seepicola]|uniref:Urocanate reductase n=1 Tax=Oceanirhabdus seepicola TaxID=2828781 RepID=A0A9J6P1N9_9CLOT|nr:flavocytochrome c [Oceanirhabdus seepicola]MCM1989961.1 flavocytochrome c [Oceanirhabdus seepicola]
MKYLKKIGLVLLACMMMISMVACGTTKNDSATSNVFTGEAEGKNGIIKVEVTIENKEIKKIDVVENHESEFTKDVFTQVVNSVVAANTAEIDTISGATLTSSALIAAVADAVNKSGIELTAKKVDNGQAEKVEDVTTDVVIIGAGGAGLTAAIQAKEDGANVILVEKNAVVGGNTNFATGGLNAAGTKFQKEKGIEDSVELFIEDTMKGGKNLNNPELVNVLAERSSESVDWLTERGADLSDVGRLGGASVNRCHRPTGGAPVGDHLVKVLNKNAKEIGVEIRLETKAIEILHNENKVTGIKVQDAKGNEYVINAKAVVVATGGFGANQDMVVKYDAKLKGFGTTNGPGATGDAVGLLEALKAGFVDMDKIQTHPTVVPGKSKLITEAVRGNGAILVNREAKRFIDELQTRDVVSAAELKQEGATAFLVFDQNVRESLSAIEKYYKLGLLTEAETVKELAEKIGVDAEELENTVNTYNTFVQNNEDKDFARANMKTELNKGPFYAVEVGPAVHHTMGGVTINTEAQVITEAGEVIEGLFAAGEVTGGVHGANRLGGNAVADITTFGRIAGANAAKSAK